MTMNKPEMEFVRFDGADIITTSGGDGLVHVFNLGDGETNAVFTYGFADPTQNPIYVAPTTGIVATELVEALNAALGVSDVTTSTFFIKYVDAAGQGTGSSIGNLSGFDVPATGADYNGAYKWDNIGSGYKFYRQ